MAKAQVIQITSIDSYNSLLLNNIFQDASKNSKKFLIFQNKEMALRRNKAVVSKFGHNFVRFPDQLSPTRTITLIQRRYLTTGNNTMTMIDNASFLPSTKPVLLPELNSWKLDILRHQRLAEKFEELLDDKSRMLGALRRTKTIQNDAARRKTADRIRLSIAKLDDRLDGIKEAMHEFEGRILTHEPKTDQDVQTLLRFVSSTLAFGHKIDSDYLSDVLLCCADATRQSSSKIWTH